VVADKPPNWSAFFSARWQVVDHAIKDWGSTLRLAFLLAVMGVVGWGGWIVAVILSR
jgi:hypothetical protein